MTTPGNPRREEPLLTLPDVASRLNITERHVRRLVTERRIPFHKVGRFLRFKPTDVDEWLEEHRVPPLRRRPAS